MSALPTSSPTATVSEAPGAPAVLRSRRPRTLKAFRAGPGTYALLTIGSAIFMVPLIFVVSISLSTDQTVSSGQLSVIPREFNWQNFVDIFATTCLWDSSSSTR